jgi:hypothetical protein
MAMGDRLRKTLEEKGWETEDIERAINIMESDTDHKAGTRSDVGKILYWMALILVIIGNLLLSVVLVPFLLVLSSWLLYVMVGCVALVWGLLFSIIINDIEELDVQHHIIAGIFIPFIAIFNVYMMVNLSNSVKKILQISQIQQSPWLVGIVYVAFFMLPYFFTKVVPRFRKK